MFALNSSPLYFLMSEINTSGGATAGNVESGNDFIGRDGSRYDSNVHINFDRASNWDPEREGLTPLQRIRDLETHVYGDRRGFIVGILRQMRNLVVWLIILSVVSFLILSALAILIMLTMRGMV